MSTPTVPENQVEAARASGVGERTAPVSRWSRISDMLLTEHWLIRLASLLVLGLYVRSIAFAPVYDDNVMTSWSGRLRDIGQFFLHDIFGSDGTAHSVYYRPISLTYSFLLGHLAGGAPGWGHLSAILLHLAVMILAYQFGRLLFHDGRLALLTAVLFALHPTKVESVAWVGSSFVDGLVAVFFFASLITFLKWFENKSAFMLTCSVILFACAMFTKETMVFVPILIVVYLWLASPRTERISRIMRILPPYGAVWIVYMAIRHQIIKPPVGPVEYVHPTYTLANLWTAPYAIWWYLRHLVAPWGFAVEYGTKTLQRPTLLGFVLPGIGVLLLLAAVFWIWRKQSSPVAGFLIIWFALTLAPAVIFATMVSEHDRYLYIPAYAFSALVAWAILYLGKMKPKMRFAVALGVVVLWSGLTWHEMGYWDCDKALWSRVLEISPSQPKAQLQLALIYGHELKDVPKALNILDQGLRDHPDSLKVCLVRADILYGNKQFDEARNGYLKLLQLTEPLPGRPLQAGLQTEVRAVAASQLAVLDLAANNFVEAERYIRLALNLAPQGVGYHSTLSRILTGEGRTKEAAEENALELRLRIEQQRGAGSSVHP